MGNTCNAENSSRKQNHLKHVLAQDVNYVHFSSTP